MPVFTPDDIMAGRLPEGEVVLCDDDHYNMGGVIAERLARIGPAGDGGALLSAHSDVVPAAGQVWQGDPFRLRRARGRLYGRGTAGMKGFLASALAVAGMAAQRNLTRLRLLALSYDEAVGCLGIREIIDHVIPTLGRPDFCIVGEPTGMRVAVGHKGKAVYRATCRGAEHRAGPGHGRFRYPPSGGGAGERDHRPDRPRG